MGGGGQAVPGDAEAPGEPVTWPAIAQHDEPRQRQAVRSQLDGLPAAGRGPELPAFGVVAQTAGYLGIPLLELPIAHAVP